MSLESATRSPSVISGSLCAPPRGSLNFLVLPDWLESDVLEPNLELDWREESMMPSRLETLTGSEEAAQ